MIIKNKKNIITSSILALILFSTQANAWHWRPGPLVYDPEAIALEESMDKVLKKAFNETIDQLKKNISSESILLGKKSQFDFNKNLLQQSNKTETEYKIYNKKSILDMNPDVDSACRFLIAMEYVKNEPQEKARQKIAKAYSSVSSNSIKGNGFTERQKLISLYEQMKDSQKTQMDFTSVQQWMGKKTIDSNSAKNAFLAVDALTYTEGRSNIKPTILSEIESEGYKRSFVERNRNALFLNIERDLMLDPVFSKVGAANKEIEGLEGQAIEGGTKPGSGGSGDYLDQISKDITQNNNAAKTGQINLPQGIEPDKNDKQQVVHNTSSSNLSKEKFLETFLVAPLPSTYITSKFQPARTIAGLTRKHNGVDFRGAVGTPIYATQSGVVGPAGWQSGDHGAGYGLRAYIMHDKSIISVYGHMSNLVVKSGQHVERGQIIGYVGNSGRSFGSHLHFGITTNGSYSGNANWIDPMGISGTSAIDAVNQLASDAGNSSPQHSHDGYEDQNGRGYHDDFDANNNDNESKILRQKLLIKALSLYQDWEEYKQFERIKYSLAVKILKQTGNVNR